VSKLFMTKDRTHCGLVRGPNGENNNKWYTNLTAQIIA